MGLFKQTSTISTAMVTDLTDEENRKPAVGQLRTAITGGFFAGQFAGATLSAYHEGLPCGCAVALYGVCAVVAAANLGSDRGTAKAGVGSDNNDARVTRSKSIAITAHGGGFNSQVVPTKAGVLATFMKLLAEPGIAGLLAVMVLHLITETMLRSMASVYELSRFGLSQSELGFLGAYKTALSVISPVLSSTALAAVPDRTILLGAALGSAAGWLVDHVGNVGILLYAGCSVPLCAFSGACWRLAMQTLLTKTIPPADIGAGLGVVDVLSSASGILGPVLGGFFIGTFGITPHDLRCARSHPSISLSLVAWEF